MRRRLPLAVAVFGIGAWAAAPADARAESRPVLFSLQVEETPLERCGGEPALRSAVEGRLRRDAFVGEDVADIAVSVGAAADEGEGAAKWHAVVIEHDPAGTELGRRDVPLPVSDCAKALDTLAVVLSIMVGSARTTTEAPREREHVEHVEHVEARRGPKTAQTPDARPTTADRRSDLAPTHARRPWTIGASGALVSGTGTLPGLAWGVELGAVVGTPVSRLALFARGTYWLPRGTGTRPAADFDRLGGALLPCIDVLQLGRLVLSGCGGAGVSRVHARSGGLTRGSESSVFVDALGELRLAYALATARGLRIEPVLAAQGSVSLLGDRFQYRDAIGNDVTLLDPAPVGFQAGAGVAVHLQ